jgi:hypothetical protein
MHTGDGVEGELLQGLLESLRGFFYGIAEGEIEDIFFTVLHLELGRRFEHLSHPRGSSHKFFHIFGNGHIVLLEVISNIKSHGVDSHGLLHADTKKPWGPPGSPMAPCYYANRLRSIGEPW